MVNFLSSMAGVIEVLNSSFYIICHCVSFQKWVNVGNIVSFHCSLLKQVSSPDAFTPDYSPLIHKLHFCKRRYN
jgi:hypothetical protein